jgi:hypothetical protein
VSEVGGIVVDMDISGGKDVQLETDDAVVLILGAPSRTPALKDRIDGITRLEKLLFLLQRETEIGPLLTEDPEFFAHNFGPFSSKVYQAVDTLAAAGLVEDSAELASSTEDAWETQQVIGEHPSDPYATRTIALTQRGRRYYQALIRELPEGTEKLLSEFKQAFGGIPLRRLVRYVYERYPEMTDKSVIKDEILGK